MTWNSSRVPAGLAAVVVAFGLAVAPLPREGILTSELQDALHAIGFAVFTFVLLHAIERSAPATRRWTHLGLALAFALALAVGTEGIQKFTPRDSDPFDFARDLLGIAIGTAAAAVPWVRTLPARTLLVVAAVIGTGAALSPLYSTLRALDARQARFPVLHDFEEAWERLFLATRGGDLRFDSEGHARLTLIEGNYPALIVREFPSDWSGYDRLAFRIAAEGDVPTDVAIRVDDVLHDGTYHDRFQTRVRVDAEWRDVTIPLRAIREGPRDRHLDLSAVKTVVLFGTPNTPRPLVLRVDDLRLE